MEAGAEVILLSLGSGAEENDQLVLLHLASPVSEKQVPLSQRDPS